MKEFIVAGLLMSPFVRYALLGLVVILLLRLVLVRMNIYRWFWHPLLAEAAMYICVVALLNLFV